MKLDLAEMRRVQKTASDFLSVGDQNIDATENETILYEEQLSALDSLRSAVAPSSGDEPDVAALIDALCVETPCGVETQQEPVVLLPSAPVHEPRTDVRGITGLSLSVPYMHAV